MRTYRPDRSGLSVLRVLILLIAVTMIILVNYFVPVRFPALVTDIAISGVTLLLTMIYLPLYFSTIKYAVTETEITCSSGVFLKYHQSIKIASVQYTAVASSPFSEYTGLNFIIFFVYGGRLKMFFLSKKDVVEILSITGTGGEML